MNLKYRKIWIDNYMIKKGLNQFIKKSWRVFAWFAILLL